MSSGLSSTSRIFPAFTRPPRPPSGPSQGEVEGRSPIDGSLGPDPAAVPGDDAPDRRETDAGALEFGRGVQALEHAEQLVCVLHVEAGPIVPDQEGPLAAHIGGSEFDLRPRLFRGVLPAVAEQIIEGHPQQARVSPCLDLRGTPESPLPLRGGPLQPASDVPRPPPRAPDPGAHSPPAGPSKFP